MLRRSLLVLGLLLAAPAAHAVSLAVGVHDAYLHLDPVDSAGTALRVDLGSIGVLPGYKIHLVAVGDWNAGPYGDVQHALLGVFSSDATVLAPTLLHRVPGAISAGPSNFSGGTWPSGEPTDIVEDFLIPDAGIDVVVPQGSTQLFISVADIYYRDNSDPDGDLGVQITIVSTADVEGGAPRAWLHATPNPFRSATSLSFESPRAARAEIRIYDAAGRELRRMDRSLAAGANTVEWDGLDNAGQPTACGVLFYEVRVDGARHMTRLVKLQ
jgi:hypothetical protein